MVEMVGLVATSFASNERGEGEIAAVAGIFLKKARWRIHCSD